MRGADAEQSSHERIDTEKRCGEQIDAEQLNCHAGSLLRATQIVIRGSCNPLLILSDGYRLRAVHIDFAGATLCRTLCCAHLDVELLQISLKELRKVIVMGFFSCHGIQVHLTQGFFQTQRVLCKRCKALGISENLLKGHWASRYRKRAEMEIES